MPQKRPFKFPSFTGLAHFRRGSLETLPNNVTQTSILNPKRDETGKGNSATVILKKARLNSDPFYAPCYFREEQSNGLALLYAAGEWPILGHTDFSSREMAPTLFATERAIATLTRLLKTNEKFRAQKLAPLLDET